MRPPIDRPVDLYQDWGSARNWLTGLPIYTEHSVSVPRHLGLTSNPNPLIDRNAHPPTSVLAVLPLAGLGFSEAVLAWNLISLGALAVSLALVGRELGCPREAWLPLLILAGFCYPVYANLHLAQWGMVLGALLIGAWVLDRRGRPGAAGALIGLAALLKLFPGFLLLVFVARREWRAVGAAILVMGVGTLATAVVLGPSVYLDYVRDVIPGQRGFWGMAFNLSLNGFWHKLFDPSQVSGRLAALWPSRLAANLLTLASAIGVTAAVAWVAAASRRQPEDRELGDGAFALGVIGMLLVEPVTWNESLTQMLLPIGWMVSVASARGVGRTALMGLLTILWLPTDLIVGLAPPSWGAEGGEFPSLFSLTFSSTKTYALLGAFVLAWRMGDGGVRSGRWVDGRRWVSRVASGASGPLTG